MTSMWGPEQIKTFFGSCAISVITQLGGREYLRDDKGNVLYKDGIPIYATPDPERAFFDMMSFQSSSRYDYATNRYIQPEPLGYKQIEAAHVVFCQAQGGTYGETFRDYLITHQLGSVLETPPAQNNYSVHRSDPHPVIAWIWTPDHKACEAHYNSLVPKRKEQIKASKLVPVPGMIKGGPVGGVAPGGPNIELNP